jgi:hypothetical protein
MMDGLLVFKFIYKQINSSQAFEDVLYLHLYKKLFYLSS